MILVVESIDRFPIPKEFKITLEKVNLGGEKK